MGLKRALRVFRRVVLAVLAVALIVLGTLAFLRWRGLILLPHEADPKQWEVFGVDVSSYQGVVDWSALAGQGVDFAFIKATEGSGLQDRAIYGQLGGGASGGRPCRSLPLFQL